MLLLLASVRLALASGDHSLAERHVLPQHVDAPDAIAAAWDSDGDWRVSPFRAFEPDSTRFGALLWADAGSEPQVQVRLRDAAGRPGPWRTVRETSRGEGWRVLVLDLDAPASRAQVRVRDAHGLQSLAWELLTPVNEPRAPADAAPALPEPPSVSAALQEIGVIPRETWGSRATTCTSTENDWYRMAIHHTAGTQTSGGTVQGAVQALQAYAMDSGEYCDIPYQFLVGYDGSLWEGRNLAYTSGATGGGNNDGNIAVSFLGCYTGSGCPGSSHEATDAMMAWARVLVQTLAIEHDYVTTDDVLKGHRDWPGNSTVCPGDYVYARLDELKSEAGYFDAELVDQSWSGEVQVPVGEEVALWVDLLNTGMDTWDPGVVALAPTPRDVASELQGSDWPSPTRAATLAAAVPPGGTGRFAFSVAGDAPGTVQQDLTLVAEWITWFQDLPYGGDFPDDGVSLVVQVVEEQAPGDGGDADTGGEEDPDGDGGGGDGWTDGQDDPAGAPPGLARPLDSLGGCSAAPVGGGPAVLLVLGLVGRRRQRRPSGTGASRRSRCPE